MRTCKNHPIPQYTLTSLKITPTHTHIHSRSDSKTAVDDGDAVSQAAFGTSLFMSCVHFIEQLTELADRLNTVGTSVTAYMCV